MNLADGASIGSILSGIAGVTGMLLIIEVAFNSINKRRNTKNSNTIEIITD